MHLCSDLKHALTQRRTVRLARCFYKWAEAAAARREGDLAAACQAEAGALAGCRDAAARISILEEHRC